MPSSRREFIRQAGIAGAGIAFVPRGFQNQLSAAPVYAIMDQLTESSAAQLDGHVGKKLEQTYTYRILDQSSDELIEPFRHRTETHLWQTEFWGKWFTSAVLAYRYHPDPTLMKVMQESVDALIATQSADGYIGNYTAEKRLEQWDIWGMKYSLLGLLDYHDLTHYKKALRACVRLTDYLIHEINTRDGQIVNKGNYRGMAASSILEAIGRLYMKTGDKKYLDFAQTIVAQWETPGGPNLISKASVNVHERFPASKNWYSWEQGQKAYEMMSCYEGLLELYRITGNETYKNAVEQTWQNIMDTEINIAGSGASAEMWFGGKDLQTTPVVHYQETCVTVTWIRFTQALLRLTGETKYAQAIEESYYNALLGAMSADGKEWAKYTPLNGERLPGSGQCGMKLNCCVANGPRALFTLPLTAVMALDTGLAVNFFAAGSYISNTPSGKKIEVVQETTYPLSGEIQIGLKTDRPELFEMKFRIPAWSLKSSVLVNGEPVREVQPGKYIAIKKEWSGIDTLRIQLDMSGRVEYKGKDQVYAAIKRGPILLVRDTRLPDTNLGITITPIRNAAGFMDLKPVAENDKDIWMSFTAPFLPESYTETGAAPVVIAVCDYASAGNGSTKSSFQTWIPQLFNAQKQENS